LLPTVATELMESCRPLAVEAALGIVRPPVAEVVTLRTGLFHGNGSVWTVMHTAAIG